MSITGSNNKFSIKLLVSFFFGAILVGSFSPFEWAPLAFFSLAALFYLCRELPAKQAFWLGLAFGYGQFGVGVSWVYVSLHTYGGMPPWMGVIAVFLFSSILGVFAGFTTFSAARLFPLGGRNRLLALAAFWVIFEWIKSWIFTGFAWLEVGVSQTPTWLFGLAPIGGVYLVSFAVTMVASCITLLSYHKKILPLMAMMVIFVLAWFSNQISWSSNAGKVLNVGIVQANVPINKKWQGDYRDQVIANLMSMSQQLQTEQASKQAPIDLLVWPETALPLYYQQTNEEFWQSLILPNSALLTGLVDHPDSKNSYNAAALYCDDAQQIYRKRHLVPFGEYLPMRFLLNWLLDYLQLPMSDFSSWQQPQPLSCGKDINIGLSICYEDAFASEMRRNVGDATLLVNISEDAWFGDSFAPHQRLQMGQMRARELARPMVRSANSGPSAFIDHLGNVLDKTPQFEQAATSYKIQPQTGETPYKRFGDWIIWLSVILLLLAKLTSRQRKEMA